MAETATRSHVTHESPGSSQRASQPAAQSSPNAAEAIGAPVATGLALAGAGSGDPLLDPRLGAVQREAIVLHLQRVHGNAYVQRLLENASRRGRPSSPQPESRLLAGNRDRGERGPAAIERSAQGLVVISREAACPAPPEAPTPVAPEEDPKFRAVKGKVVKVAGQEKKHGPAKAKAAEAQAAAEGPSNEVPSQAAAGQVAEMSAKEPGAFDKQAFVEAVRQAIAKITPKTEDEAEEFKESGKAGQVKDEVGGIVKQGKEGSAKEIKETTEAAPDTSNAEPKPVTPMKPEDAGAAPGPIGAAKAVPSPKPPAATSLAHAECETDSQMGEAGVTEEQLKKSNEPEFQGALDAKKQADEHAATAPKAVKAEEKAVLGQAKADAAATAGAATAGMHDSRAGALAAVDAGKSGAKGKDEVKRAEIAAKIEAIYTAAKTDVQAILTGLDAKVDAAFETGEKAAREAFENYVDRRMREYKDKRSYADAVVDFVAGLPPEVNTYYTEGRDLYLTRMDGVINKVAGIVEGELNRAKARIARGKKEISDYVASLPKALQKIGKEVQGEFGDKFDALDQEINAKQDELVQSLAQKYAAARDAVDSRIKEMQAENKGLVDKAKDAIGGVIETIKNLKNMLMGVLAKAAGVIDKIIADPIAFLGNLVNAIKTGLNQFVGNIATHLKNGLMGWLLGELAGAGITLPKSLDFKGILDLVMQVMGLTYNAIRARAVKIVGEPVVKKLEQVAEVFKVLITEGPAGLWKWIVDKVSNLADTVLGGIKDLVITKVITAGITWLISLLNPASAFVKACKMIYDVIMFFVERGSQIMSLVNAIIDGVGAIASGSIGAAANLVENALGKALPVAISFLASLLGLGGLSEKIKKIIEAVQKPVGKAVDAVINFAVKGFKKVVGAIGGLFKGKDKKGKQPDERKPEQKEAAEKAAVKDAEKLLDAPEATPATVRAGLPKIKTSHKLTSIALDEAGDNKYRVTALISRAVSDPKTLTQLVAVQCPINAAKYAGAEFEFKDPKIAKKYKPLYFTKLGFPDFAPFAIASVTIKMHGNRSYRRPDGDFGNANEKAGYPRNHEHPNHTWHHKEDRKTMELIPWDLHDAVRHSGGCWVIAYLGEKK